jgi:N-methylhydantoinase A
MSRVLVPVNPGLLSAVGMLTARPTYEFSHSVLRRGDPAALSDWRRLADVAAVAQELSDRAKRALRRDGVPEAAMDLTLRFDLRYVGQSYEITVPAADAVRRFEAEHERLYGYKAAGRDMELVTVRCIGRGSEPAWRLPRGMAREPGLEMAAGRREVFAEDGPTMYHVIDRDALRVGDRLTEPAIISEYSATTIMPFGWSAVVTEHAQILLTRQAEVRR